MSLKSLFSSAGGASSDVIETEVVSTASIRDVFEDNSCVALYRFEGDATDTSGNFNGTASNITYGAGKFGQGAVFNGSSSYIAAPYNKTIIDGNKPFSLSIYAKTNFLSESQCLFSLSNNGVGGAIVLEVNVTQANKIIFRAYGDEVGVAMPIQDLEWHHYCICNTTNGIKLYQDGVFVSNYTAITPNIGNGTLTTLLRLGAETDLNTAYGFNGSIDQVRIFNRALTAEEVAFLYVEEKTVVKETVRELKDLVDPFLDKSGIALYKMDGNAQDAGGVYNGTPTNMSYTSGKFGDCGVFNGSSSNVKITQNAYSSNAFSVSCWVKFNALGLDQRFVVCNSNTYSKYFRINIRTDNKISAFYGASNSAIIISPSTYTTGVFYHIAMSAIQGSNLSLYINGVLIQSIANGGTGYVANLESEFGAWVGSGRGGVSEILNGSIDQLRIFNRALTAEEVAFLYAEKKPQVSTINLTDPFGDNSAVALYKMDGNALDAGGSYNGTASGVTYEEGKLGHCAVFNGTSANINTGYNYGSLFALSLWVKTTSSGWVASSYTSDTAGGGLTVEANVVKLEFGGGGKMRYLYGTKVVNDGAWHHIVALSNGATGTIYVDGVLDVSSPFVHYNSSGNIYLGKRGTLAYYFPGKMDQVRLFKRMLSQEEVEILYNEKPNDTTEDGLVAYYPLDINANDTAGTYEGTATGVTFDGDSAYFNGTSSQISVPSIVSKFNTQNIFGVSLWFKGTQTSIPVGLFSVRGLASESVIFSIALNRTVAGELALDVGTSGNFIILGRHNGAYNNGGWHHVYADIDFTTKAFNLYADGVKIAGGTNASMLKSTSASYAYIGCSYLSQYFAGNLDEVRIYERALTAQEVSDIYNYGR